MPNRLKITIVVAIFFGFIAAYGIYNFLRQQRELAEATKQSTQDVVVAEKDIPAGTTITEKTATGKKEKLVKVAAWPKDSVPAGAFSKTEEVMGKVVKVKVVKGEPILESKMSVERGGLTIRLSPGHRAVAVRVDEIIGVSGFIAPDDRVDVIVTVEPPGKNAEKLSKIVLQNRRVLSVAQRLEQEKEGKPKVVRSITLEVTPEEAEKISLASQEGKIALALRAEGDDKLEKTRGINKRALLATPAPRRRGRRGPRPAAAKKYRVEVYMGSKRSVVEF